MRLPHRPRYSTRILLPVALACVFSLAAIATAIQSFRGAVRGRQELGMDHAADLILSHQMAQLVERKLAKSRSFIITRDEAFAQEMEDARSELVAALGELKGRIKNPEAGTLLRQIAAIEARHHALLRDIMSRRRKGRSAGELVPLLTERLKPIRDDLDAAIHALIAFKDARLQATDEEASSSVRFAQRVSVSAGLVALFAFAVVLWLVRRLSRAQLEIENGLRRSNAELDTLVAERTRDLSAFNRELESFSYSVAHDLRTPLRAITNFSDLALAQLAEAAEAGVGARVRQIRDAGLKMSRTIDALLSLSRLTRKPLNMAEIDLSGLAAEVNETIAQANPGRRVETAIAPGLRDTGDTDLLRLALQNLLDNAWKFTAGVPDARVEFGRIEAGGGPAYRVQDNGAGFDSRFAHKLFAPFERLHAVDDFAGAGIGLAAVERIIHRHGGSVWAEGRPGRGAAFFFTLGRRVPEKDRPDQSDG